MRKLLFLLATTLLCLAANGQFLVRDELQKLCDTIAATDYPNADSALADDRQYIAYQADGTVDELDDMAYIIFTDRGVRQWNTISENFNARYERRSAIAIEIYSPGQEKPRILNPQEAAVLTSDNSSMESNIYDPMDKLLNINIPELRPGDLVRFCVRRETFKPRIPNSFSIYEVLESSIPILRYDITVDAPAELPLKNIALLSPVQDTVTSSKTEKDGRILYTWQARNVPQALPEPQMPALHTCAQRLLVSTHEDWKAVSKWYWNLCEPHLATNDEMKKTVDELTRNCANEFQKINGVFTFVSQKIRYMGETTEDDAPGYEPHDAIQTFTKRHGVCRDKAALLAALLRLAGTEAYPVLIYVGPRKDGEVPLPYFNHAITAAKLSDGKIILMDSTNEHTTELFPSYLGNRSFLIATPEGTDLGLSGVAPAKNNELDISTSSALDAQGGLSGTTTFRFNGIQDTAYRGFLASSSAEERRLFFEQIVRQTIPGARLERFDIMPKNVMDTSQKLVVTVSYRAENTVAPGKRPAILHIPSFADRIGLTRRGRKLFSLDKRRFPMLFDYTGCISEIASLSVDEQWGACRLLPANENFELPFFNFQRIFTMQDNVITMRKTTAFLDIQISPEQYLDMKRGYQAIEFADRQQLLFEPPAQSRFDQAREKADDLLLQKDTAIELLPDGKARFLQTFRKQLLTYKGMKENAEITLFTFPDYQNAKVKYARVITPDETYELNLDEIKVIPSETCATAPRYPKGHYIVANLPGVTENCIVEYQIEMDNAIPESIRSGVFLFSSASPIQKQKLTLRVPDGLKVRPFVSQNGLLFPEGGRRNLREKVTREQDCTVYAWENISPLIPSPKEVNLPSDIYTKPFVAYSLNDWKTLANTTFRALQEKASLSDAQDSPLRAFIRRLAQIPAPFQRVSAMEEHFAQNIRKDGPSFTELPLAALSPAERTFEDGYGNNADRAILYHAILSALGYKPEFILAHSRVEPDLFFTWLKKHCDPDSFPVVLVRAKIGGRMLWFNCNSPYAHPGTCPYEGVPILTRNGKIGTLSVDRDFQNSSEQVMDITVDANGTARLVWKTFLRGNDYAAKRQQDAEQTPEERRRERLEALTALSMLTTENSEITKDFSHYPAQVTVNATIKAFASLQDGILSLSLPHDIRLPAIDAGSRRNNHYQFNACSRGSFTVNVHFPKNTLRVLRQPEQREITLGGRENVVSAQSMPTKDGCQFVFQHKLAPCILSPAQYLRMKEETNIFRQKDFPFLLLQMQQK